MNIATTQQPTVHEMTLSLTRKGQVTIPVAARRLLGLERESKVALVIDERDQTVRLQIPRYPTIASLAGAAGKSKQSVSWEEMLGTARAEALAHKHADNGGTVS